MITKKTTKRIIKSRQRSIILPDEPSPMDNNINEYLMMFYGAPGVGKTRFVNDLADRVYFISTDRGTRFYNMLRNEISSVEEMDEIIKLLSKKKHKPYDMICIDHVDDWLGWEEEATTKKLGVDSLFDKSIGFGKGWAMYKRRLASVFRSFLQLGQGLVFISHETIKNVKTGILEHDRIMPDLSKNGWKLIIPISYIVGHIGFKVVKKGGKKQEIRILTTQPEQSLYAKDRTNRIKPVNGWEPLDADKFIESFKQGVTDGQKEDNTSVSIKRNVKRKKVTSKTKTRRSPVRRR